MTIDSRVWTRRFASVVLPGIASLAIGCAGTSVTQAQPATRRSNVAAPFISLSPASIELARGASVVLTALPRGGEAILFSVDWAISEGAAGGTLTAAQPRNADGSFNVTYTAPAIGAGPYHVTATIKEYPAAFQIATVTIR